ncbi:MAG: hypothetical protein ABIR68_19565, partial [Ilumatobacteraceae bacterium]
MGLVMDVCDRVYVIEFGVLIAAGTPDVVRRSPRVIEAYLGGSDSIEPDDVDAAVANVNQGLTSGARR